MGVDFTAYLGHTLNRNDIQILCNKLNSRALKHIDDFHSYLLPHNPKDEGEIWKVVEGAGGTVEIDGPCGLDFTFSEKVCYFHHFIRWSRFLLDEQIQLYLRKVTYDLAGYFSSDYAIYVPDSGSRESGVLDFIWDDENDENKDIEHIRNWLLSRCGAPKEKISDIYKECEDYWDSEGYYVDYFKDM